MLDSTIMLITSESLKASLCFPFPDRKEMFEIVHQFLDQLNEAIGVNPSSFEVIGITYGDSMLNRADAVVPWIEFIGDSQQRSRLLAMHRVLLPDVAVDVFPPERMQAFQALRTEFHCKPDQFFGQINIRLPHDSTRQHEFERGLAEMYFWHPRTQTPTPVCIVKTGLNYCCHYLAENPDHHPCGYPDLPEGYDFAQLENLREQLLADLAEYMVRPFFVWPAVHQ